MIGTVRDNHTGYRLEDKEDIEAKLQMELTGLSILKDTLQKSSQLTKSMNGILTSFDERLAKLEKTILPVYNDTSSLQRRQENIDKTLKALDHIIDYYSVSKDVEETIKDGAVGDLESYLESLACIQRAIDYFRVNNPTSPELHNLEALFNEGGVALEKEFRNLLNRHCKPTPPVLIMDMVSPGDEELYTEDDKTSMEQLPEKAMNDLICIAEWLVRHGKEDYTSVYATIRSNILLRSLQGWKDYQKSSSGGGGGSGGGGTVSGSTLTVAPHGSPALSRSRFKDTPTRKTAKRFQQVLMKKATSTVMKYSQSVEQATGLPLGHRRQGSIFEMRDENIDSDVLNYLSSVTALYKLMQCELHLLSKIIPESYWSAIFERIFQASLDMILQDGENLATRAKKCAGKHDFLSSLIVFPILKHLKMLKPDFEGILRGCQSTISSKLDSLIISLRTTGIRALEDFNDSIKNDLDRQMPKDGTVHELTSNAMIFLEHLKFYAEPAGGVLAMDPHYGDYLLSVPDREKNEMSVAVYIARVLGTLGLTLSNKSEAYSDPYLKSIFRLNNVHYVLKSLQRTGILEITKLCNPDLETQYTDQILEQKRLYSQSWSRVLHYVMEVDRPLPNHVGQQKLKDKDKQNIKDKFTGFNKEMEDIYKIQKGYAIPDTELRESLKRENKDFILPKYSAFYDKYKDMSFTKHKEKYIRYTLLDVRNMIDRFFDVAA